MKSLNFYLSKKSLSLGNEPALDRKRTGYEPARLCSVLVLFLVLFSFGVGNAWATDYFSDALGISGTSTVSSRTGWAISGSAYGHYGSAIRLGTSSASGSITKTAMAAIGSTPTNLVVRFSAKKWNTDNVGLTITVNNAGTANVTSITTLAKQATTNAAFSWDEKDYYEIIITGATSETTITFTTSTTKRVLLGNVSISSASDATYRFKLVENAKDIEDGDYLIVYNNTNALNDHYDNYDANSYATYTDISTHYTSSTKSFAYNSTTEALMYRAFATTNGYALRKAYSGEFLGTSSSSTGSYLRWDRGYTATQNEWTLGVNSIVSVYATSNGIRWYNTSGQYRFAMYGKTAQSEIQLFKKEEVPAISCDADPTVTAASNNGSFL